MATILTAIGNQARVYYHGRKAVLEPQQFDQEYVRRLTDGDPSVERHFTVYFGQMLLIKLRSRVRSPQMVEDIRQETFLRVLSRLRERGGIDHPERLGGFVNSVCNNIILESYRSGKRNVQMPETDFDPVDKTINMDGALVDRERKTLIRQVLAELAEIDRRILEMLFLEEKDKDEVCAAMSVSRDYLRVLVHRARIRFRAVLSKRNYAVQ